MKKINILILLFILGILTTSCGGSTSVETLDFPISEDMKLESSRESEIDNEKIELSTYSVEGGDINKFLFDYEKILNGKGWKTINNLKPRGLTVEKDSKEVTIIIYEENDTLLVDIIPTPKEEE